jgi:hypothetical protein
MKTETDGGCDGWALLRFSIIGGLLASPPERGRLKAAFEELSRRRYRHPTQDGESVCFGASTIERWYYEAKEAADPIAALVRKVRSDAGQTPAMSPALLAALLEQYAAHKRWSYQLHADNLAALVEENAELGQIPGPTLLSTTRPPNLDLMTSSARLARASFSASRSENNPCRGVNGSWRST